MSKEFYTYVLLSKRDDKLYVGQTENIERRLQLHNNGKVLSTKHRRPFILVRAEKYKTRSEAYKSEQYLKSGQGREWLQKYLNDLPAYGGRKNL